MLDDSYKWFHLLGERSLFLSNMERMFFLSSIQSMSLHRLMEWDLTKEQSGVSLRRISHQTIVLVDHDRNVVELLSGSLKAEYPVGETPHQAAIFINQFMTVKGDFPKDVF